MSWSSNPVNTRPARVRRGGWASNPVVKQRPTPAGGWLAITYMLAAADQVGIDPKTLLKVLANGNVSGLNGLVPQCIIDYVYHDVLGPADSFNGLAPSAGIDVLFANANPTAPLILPAATMDGVIAGAPAQAVGISISGWSTTVVGNATTEPILLYANSDVVVLANAQSGLIALAPTAAASFPAQAPTQQLFNTVGTFSYAVPDWSNFLDFTGIGGGCGGRGGGPALSGGGGYAAVYQSITLQRGVDIPFTVTTITVVVGDGSAGSGGAYIVVDPANGNPTQFKDPSNAVLLNCPGGLPNFSTQNGQASTAKTYQGFTYPGANGGTGNGGAGGAPGAGAAGGNLDFGFAPGSAGGKGGRGSAGVVARQS